MPSALGEDADGRPVVVTCSYGVDLDLVPGAADDRAMHAPGARLVLRCRRDVHPVTGALAPAPRNPPRSSLSKAAGTPPEPFCVEWCGPKRTGVAHPG